MQNKLFFALAAALLCTVSLPALAAKSTADFVKTAAIANKFEIDSSKLALERSKNTDVRGFAQQMVDDHTKAADKLKTAVGAAKLGDGAVPGDLDDAHKDLLNKLKADDDSRFDKDYVGDQVEAHHEAVGMFGDYAKDGDNAVIKSFASDMLPTLKQHQDHVSDLASKLPAK